MPVTASARDALPLVRRSAGAWITCRLGHAATWLIRALGAVAVAGLAACGGSGGGDPPPPPPPAPTVITSQPASLSVTAGSDATFTVTANGDGLTYQWQASTNGGVNWADIAGATSTSYTRNAVVAGDDGLQVRVQVRGTAGNVTSSAASLTVTALVGPAIVTQPADQNVAAGGRATFSVTATGTTPGYRWQRSSDGGTTFADVAGATAATLTFDPVTLADNGARVRVIVSNGAGSVTSNTVLLTVLAPPSAPTITTPPAAVSVVAPQPATFSVVASGTAPLAYQWQRSNDGGTTYADISGATASSLTISATTVGDNGALFRVRVSNSLSNTTSAGALLTVSTAGTAPSFTQSPQPQTVTAPAAATFSVSVAGSPTPTLQWQVSTDGGATYVNITGANSAAYTTPPTVVGDSGKRFRVVASNSAGSAASAAAVLTVQAPAAGAAFAYMSNSGSLLITGYAIDRGTGAVSPTPGSPYSGPATAAPNLVLHPNGRLLFVVEKTQPRTWVYAIDAADGRLTLLPGSPYTTPSPALDLPVIDPSGSYMIYRAGFQVASFAINSTTGALTSVGSLVFAVGSSVEFSADGQLMFIQESTNDIRTFRVDPLTLLTDPSTRVPIIPFTRFFARGGFLVAQTLGFGITSYAIGATGTLSPVQGVSAAAANLVVHPNARCVYASSLVSGSPPAQFLNVTPLVLDLTTGALTTGAPVRIGVPGTLIRSTYPLQMSLGGTFGYLSTIDGTLNSPLTPVAIDGTACTIAAGTPFDIGGLAGFPVYDPASNLLVSYQRIDARLNVSRIDPVTRVPVPVSGSPFITNGTPWQVVVR